MNGFLIFRILQWTENWFNIFTILSQKPTIFQKFVRIIKFFYIFIVKSSNVQNFDSKIIFNQSILARFCSDTNGIFSKENNITLFVAAVALNKKQICIVFPL